MGLLSDAEDLSTIPEYRSVTVAARNRAGRVGGYFPADPPVK